MREIFVTNKNDFHHCDSYDGESYEFPPNVRVAVPVDAAVHMLGFNMPDKSEVLSRLGWASKYDPKTRSFVEDLDGVKKLARFVFTKGVMIEAPAEAPAEEAQPAAPAGKRRPKGEIEFLTSDTPLV